MDDESRNDIRACVGGGEHNWGPYKNITICWDCGICDDADCSQCDNKPVNTTTQTQ